MFVTAIYTVLVLLGSLAAHFNYVAPATIMGLLALLLVVREWRPARR